ncbi:hypothetical protein U9M48_011461 [Paspalum notatum var. saurae]|uniref:F-box domain-containing protein n=1 Tax=Paspalum notatum var. saurae TaxID=547442 RepID=A0AAQ3SVQ7_PASNO
MQEAKKQGGRPVGGMDDALTDDLVEEVLLRLPPADPACLIRAAVVCRRWRRLISDQAFRRRFLELYPRPPTLGFLHLHHRHGVYGTHFLPASSFRPPHADVVPAHWIAVDARHGRVLFEDASTDSWPADMVTQFVVSSPMTGDVRTLPALRTPMQLFTGYESAAVLCAAAACGCHHLDCHRGPFTVVFVHTSPSNDHTVACVYSSETDTWRTAASIHHPIGRVVLSARTAAFAGKALYFLFFLDSDCTCRLLEYDLGKEELSLIDVPREAAPCHLLLVEKGSRLVIAIAEHSKVCVWSMETSSHRHQNNHGRAWAQNRVIERESLPRAAVAATSSTNLLFAPHVLAIVDDIYSNLPHILNLDIKSGLVTESRETHITYSCAIPYTSFYFPSVGTSLMDRGSEGLREGAPSA